MRWARVVSSLASLATLLALSASASALEISASFSAFDLANGAIPLAAAQGVPDTGAFELTLGDEVCTVELSGGALVESGECPALWGMHPIGDRTATFEQGDEAVTLRLVARTAATSDAPWPGINSLAVRAEGEVAILEIKAGQPIRWLVVSPDAGLVALSNSQVAAFRSGGHSVFIDSPDGLRQLRVVHRASVIRQPPPSGSGTGESATSAPRPASVEVLCPPREARFEDHIIICVDAHRDTIEYTVHPRGKQVVKPNRQFLVRVIHKPGRKLKVSLGGERGTTAPGSRNQAPEDVEFRATGDDTPVPALVTDRVFVPRRPGTADLQIQLYDKASDELLDEGTIEFFVETTYNGAFRLGVGAVFLGAVDAQYSARTVAGSSQAELVAESEDDVNVDIILGYTAYLDADGRPQTGCVSKPWCFAPYFGLGLLSPRTDGEVDFLKSIHLGAEWEPVPNMAIGVTAVLRRVSRLAPGARVGQPIDPNSDVPTVSEWTVGLGVVLNLSPDFLRTARGVSEDVAD